MLRECTIFLRKKRSLDTFNVRLLDADEIILTSRNLSNLLVPRE